MNYEQIGSAVACNEILDELPDTLCNFIIDLEDENKCIMAKYSEEIKNLENQIEIYSEIQKKTSERKKQLKDKAQEIENESDSSYFFYSDKELKEELLYNRKVVEYAKSKIRLYEVCTKIDWDENNFRGNIIKTSTPFDFSGLSAYEQVNSLWDIL